MERSLTKRDGVSKRDGVCNPVAYVCDNRAMLATKRYGRDYKSRPAAFRRSATGFATPLHTFCDNLAMLSTKRYGRDYKSRPAAFRPFRSATGFATPSLTFVTTEPCFPRNVTDGITNPVRLRSDHSEARRGLQPICANLSVKLLNK